LEVHFLDCADTQLMQNEVWTTVI